MVLSYRWCSPPPFLSDINTNRILERGQQSQTAPWVLVVREMLVLRAKSQPGGQHSQCQHPPPRAALPRCTGNVPRALGFPCRLLTVGHARAVGFVEFPWKWCVCGLKKTREFDCQRGAEALRTIGRTLGSGICGLEPGCQEPAAWSRAAWWVSAGSFSLVSCQHEDEPAPGAVA